MSEAMTFPNSWEEFLNDYSFKDIEEIYTNGSELIPVFRVKQLINHYFLFSDKFNYNPKDPSINKMIEDLRKNQEELEKRIEKITEERIEEKKRQLAALEAEAALLKVNGARIPTTIPVPAMPPYIPYPCSCKEEDYGD